MNTDITVVLNGFRRPERLEEQYNAVMNQTIKPKDVLYWQNTCEEYKDKYNTKIIDSCKSAISNTNFGVWSRFYYAFNARTDWVVIFDDDTIPGNMWFENCLETQKTHPGLHGTIGILFYHNYISYRIPYRVGWDNPNDKPVEVTFVGHSWFFHRDLLPIFFRELPDKDQISNVGEDIHISYCLQKYSDYKTYVPPHPKDNQNLWGSLKGWQYGDDGKATASFAFGDMERTLNRYVEKGFKLCLVNPK